MSDILSKLHLEWEIENGSILMSCNWSWKLNNLNEIDWKLSELQIKKVAKGKVELNMTEKI